MIVFAAEFPASNSATIQNLLECCQTWLIGSKHYPWDGESELLFEQEQFSEYTKDGHKAAFGYVARENDEIGGISYTWNEDGRIRWTMEIGGLKDEQGLWVSVQLACESLRAGAALPPPQRPYVIKILLEMLGGGVDGEFTVMDRPHVLDAGSTVLAESIISGMTTTWLPIVYVSSGFSGRPRVSIHQLARKLAALSHVVVEPDRAFSMRLATAASRVNVYGGAVGLYWPRSSGQHVRFIPSHFEDPRALEAAVVQAVLQSATTYARPPRSISWSEIREALARKRLAELKVQKGASVEDYMNAFDAEIIALTNQRDAALREVSFLRDSVNRLRQARPGVIALGAEQEIYPGEMADIAHRSLQESSAAALDGTRRKVVLMDLLSSNRPTGRADEIESGVKNVLSNIMKVRTEDLDALRKLGFVIDDGGKHYKATYGGDPRLSFTIFKTASDHRAGKNLASEMIRTLFK